MQRHARISPRRNEDYLNRLGNAFPRRHENESAIAEERRVQCGKSIRVRLRVTAKMFLQKGSLTRQRACQTADLNPIRQRMESGKFFRKMPVNEDEPTAS